MTIGTDYSFTFGNDLHISEKNGLKKDKNGQESQSNVINPVFDSMTKKPFDIQRTNAPFNINFLSA